MKPGSYLGVLDGLLAMGAAELQPSMRERGLAYLSARQRADGGFAGRSGGSDPYYTDFGVRLLALFGATGTAPAAASAYLCALVRPPADTIELFCRLNAARLLGSGGQEYAPVSPAWLAVLDQQRVPNGWAPPGAARRGFSAYHTFLALLSLQISGQEPPAEAGSAIGALQQPDGGFADTAGAEIGQTNPTAAAVAVAQMAGVLAPEMAQRAAAFLAGLQRADGGLPAHGGARESDLLSTFTGFLTLCMLGQEDRLDIRALARYIGSLGTPDGGFRACGSDLEDDVEYTYYGAATIALLRAYVIARR